MSDDIEYVLLNKRECFVYNVPPATSASGYKAADWANCIWKGRLQVCAKGDILIIKLLESNSGAIFAACPVSPNTPVDKVIERTVDSSRYFVLTMSDKTGRKAHLGMGFDDRNDAFDFNATIQDFRRQTEAPQEVINPVISIKPAVDLSLKEGQKISLNLKPLRPPASPGPASGTSFLPPPPASRSRQSEAPRPERKSSDLLDLGEAAPRPSQPTSQPPRTFTGSLLD